MDRNLSFESSMPMTVHIWDMDETLILLKSLLDGTYAGAFDGSKDKRKGIEIGKQWENHILQVCDEHFFYEEVRFLNIFKTCHKGSLAFLLSSLIVRNASFMRSK